MPLQEESSEVAAGSTSLHLRSTGHVRERNEVIPRELRTMLRNLKKPGDRQRSPNSTRHFSEATAGRSGSIEVSEPTGPLDVAPPELREASVQVDDDELEQQSPSIELNRRARPQRRVTVQRCSPQDEDWAKWGTVRVLSPGNWAEQHYLESVRSHFPGVLDSEALSITFSNG